ncbi:MAG: arginase [Crocinitomicaceae bacterium]|nr:arginase [Crocinitomicaceae bacterium]
MAKNLKILFNTSEITAGTRGASLGPSAVVTAARDLNDTFFSENIPLELPNENQLLDVPTKFQWAKRIDGLEKVFGHVMTGMSQVFNENKFPFLLSADHGSAAATIAGIKTQYPNKRLGVVWIDAHGDLHTPFTTPSGNMHGMPLAIALNDDNEACKKNDIGEEAGAIWEKLKSKGGVGAKFSSEDLFFIAVRDTEQQEEALMARHNIKNYTVAELRERKWETISTEFQTWIDKLDILYISFDVDSMDPDITSYGTGTPVKNGITPDEAREMLNFFANQEKLCCMEFVEVNPCLDDKNTMAEITFDLMKSTVQQIKKS